MGERLILMKTILSYLIENIDKDSKIFNEEIFGPILPIFTFKKIDEAIRFINKK